MRSLKVTWNDIKGFLRSFGKDVYKNKGAEGKAKKLEKKLRTKKLNAS